MTLFMIGIPFMPVAEGASRSFRHLSCHVRNCVISRRNSSDTVSNAAAPTTHAASMSMTDGRTLTETAQEALTAL
jgi:hypothetical protein